MGIGAFDVGSVVVGVTRMMVSVVAFVTVVTIILSLRSVSTGLIERVTVGLQTRLLLGHRTDPPRRIFIAWVWCLTVLLGICLLVLGVVSEVMQNRTGETKLLSISLVTMRRDVSVLSLVLVAVEEVHLASLEVLSSRALSVPTAATIAALIAPIPSALGVTVVESLTLNVVVAEVMQHA